MPFTLTSTCVPIGIRNGSAYLDVLIIPQCDQKPQITRLLSWGTRIKALKDGFTAAGGKQLKLASSASIKHDLWTKLFADAMVGTQLTTAAPVAPNGSSLNVVTAQVAEFHQQAYGTKVAPRKQCQAPDKPTLEKFHSYAIDNHGLYAPYIGQKIQDPTKIVQNLQQLGDSEYLFSQNLTSARLRTNAPGGGAQGVFVQAIAGTGGHLMRAPDAALHSLGSLQIHYANSMRVAASNHHILTDHDDTKHLAVHASRLMRGSGVRTTAVARQVAQQINKPSPSFNQRITMLLNAPAVLEALGLVLRFELAAGDVAGLPTDGKHPFIQLDATCHAVKEISRIYTGLVLKASYCTDSGFLPRPGPSPNYPQPITAQGWLVNDGYFAGSLQMESATMSVVGFANQAGLRQASATPANAAVPAIPPVTVSHDEDVVYPILPPSPRTGGFQVWKDGLQNAIYNKRLNAPTGPLFAEDLQNGVVVDLLPCDQLQRETCEKSGTDPHSWTRLCFRESEVYDIHGVKVESQCVERGVRISATRSLAPGASQGMSHDVDETIFNWRYGSLVKKSNLGSPDPPKSRRWSSLPRNMPWIDVPPPTIETPPDKTPLFGVSYKTSMRAAFVTGSTVPFNAAIAFNSSLDWSAFTRYELMEGPALVPVTSTDNRLSDHSVKTLFVGSRISELDGNAELYCKVSQCVIAPPRVSSEVARRHGKLQDEIEKGSHTIPLTLKGDLPDHLPYTGGGPDSNAPVYLPDPAVTGIWAILTDLSGKVLDKCDVDFYQQGNGWPGYVAHTLELHATLSPKPTLSTAKPEQSGGLTNILSGWSKAIKCEVPVGETFLLVLRPKLASSIWTEHSLAGLPQIDTAGTAEDQLYQLALSDICRATITRLIHATDLPKLRPVIDPATVSVGDTSVSINVTIDPPSTSRVSLVAQWTEARDNPKKPIFEQPDVRAQLATVEVKKTADPASISITGQFPFADSGHRHLILTAVGTARYGSLFPREVSKSKMNTWASVSVEADRLATKPPHIPDVECVLPNLYWEFADDKRIRKRRMGLTVVLNRSWFTSGAGEQLAVITGTVNQDEGMISTCFDAANSEDKVSAWGLYSDYVPKTPGGLCGRLQIAEEAPPSAPSEYVPYSPNLQPTAAIMIGTTQYRASLYTPRYNQQDQQWYVNLSVSAPPVYGAMVRLLLVRYQAFAKSGNLISEPTICDFALLRPERSVTVTKSGWFLWKKIKVQIQGIRAKLPNKYPKNRFNVLHFPFRLGQPIEFRWEEGRAVPPDPHTPVDVLWQGTIHHPYPGERIVIQESEVWPDAENALTGERELPVYSDVLDI